MHVFASVTAGSANPAANFCVCGICIITNNVVFIKYKTKTIIPFIHPYSPQTLVPSVTAGTVCPAAIYVVRTIYTPTNNDVLIKYLTKNLIPNGGDTPFYAFGYEIEDFYLTRKKTGRRYVRRVYVYTYIMPI